MQDYLSVKIRKSAGPNTGMELPPKIFKAMEGEFLEYVEGQSLTVRFPVKESYSNPFGFMQGGMIMAAMDNTLGPLSLLLLPPSITTYVNQVYQARQNGLRIHPCHGLYGENNAHAG
ncbi:PaaI family thioesterase [Methylobacter sp. YRD-M1]|uniref:PaaI family thioesterase n=1 Tax=Methylobacter sp. YRD-M1 TaxID=2911520 RepID=UPI00227BB8EB|nr:hypothetical protein [Methylobacter sp. YRD-M1]WAK02114.1 hypothetical protein LZ558_20245 [Methylobacter sp. YRD-M1]